MLKQLFRTSSQRSKGAILCSESVVTISNLLSGSICGVLDTNISNFIYREMTGMSACVVVIT